MVAKISSGSSLFGILKYNLDKVENEEGKVLLTKGLVGLDAVGNPQMHLLMQSFETYLCGECHTEKPILHISLNPHPKDILSDLQFSEIAQKYMDALGYGNRPYMVVKHEDIDRHHIHIVSIRVDDNGKRIKDTFEHRRSKDITRALEKEYGLVPAEKKSQNETPFLKKVNYEQGDVKKQIANTLKELSKSYQFQSVHEFRALLSLYHITVEEVKGEVNGKPYNGLVYSALNNQGEKVGNPFNASLFGKSVGYEALLKKCEKSKEGWKDNAFKSAIKKTITDTLKQSTTPEQLQKLLQKKNMEVVFRQNEAGRIYGVTFIDHQNKCVFNGSRLGKEFSAHFFEAHFQQHETKTIVPKTIEIKSFPDRDTPQELSKSTEEHSTSSGGLFDLLPENNPVPEEKFKPYKKKKRRKIN